jgi:hypothetical protein
MASDAAGALARFEQDLFMHGQGISAQLDRRIGMAMTGVRPHLRTAGSNLRSIRSCRVGSSSLSAGSTVDYSSMMRLCKCSPVSLRPTWCTKSPRTLVKADLEQTSLDRGVQMHLLALQDASTVRDCNDDFGRSDRAHRSLATSLILGSPSIASSTPRLHSAESTPRKATPRSRATSLRSTSSALALARLPGRA